MGYCIDGVAVFGVVITPSADVTYKKVQAAIAEIKDDELVLGCEEQYTDCDEGELLASQVPEDNTVFLVYVKGSKAAYDAWGHHRCFNVVAAAPEPPAELHEESFAALGAALGLALRPGAVLTLHAG